MGLTDRVIGGLNQLKKSIPDALVEATHSKVTANAYDTATGVATPTTVDQDIYVIYGDVSSDDMKTPDLKETDFFITALPVGSTFTNTVAKADTVTIASVAYSVINVTTYQIGASELAYRLLLRVAG